MKRGYVQSISSVVEFQSIVTEMNNVGVNSEDIVVNQSFSDVAKTADEGDEIVVHSLDCFSSLAEIMNATTELSQRGIQLRPITDAWYDNSPELLTILKGVTELMFRIRANRTQLGLAQAKAKGKKLGRPIGSVKLKEKVAKVEELRRKTKISVAKACNTVNCNPRSYYRYIKSM